MKVVDGVAPVVLDVPTEGGEAHAHVKPRQGHAADVRRHVGEDGRIHHGHVVEVPPAPEVFLQGYERYAR